MLHWGQWFSPKGFFFSLVLLSWLTICLQESCSNHNYFYDSLSGKLKEEKRSLRRVKRKISQTGRSFGCGTCVLLMLQDPSSHFVLMLSETGFPRHWFITRSSQGFSGDSLGVLRSFWLVSRLQISSYQAKGRLRHNNNHVLRAPHCRYCLHRCCMNVNLSCSTITKIVTYSQWSQQ